MIERDARRKEERNQATRDRYWCDPAKKLDQNRQWKLVNRDKVLQIQRDWQVKNPDKVRAYAATRRARKNNAEGEHDDLDIASIFSEQNGKCAWCCLKLPKNYEVDHITPLFLGGSNHRSNLQLLCQPCNRSKGSKDPIDFAQQQGRLL